MSEYRVSGMAVPSTWVCEVCGLKAWETTCMGDLQRRWMALHDFGCTPGGMRRFVPIHIATDDMDD